MSHFLQVTNFSPSIEEDRLDSVFGTSNQKSDEAPSHYTLKLQIQFCIYYSFNKTPRFIVKSRLRVLLKALFRALKNANFFQWASKRFRSLTALINHEQLNMEDRFGQVMLDNLNQRGCALTGASVCKNKDSQV